MMIPKKIYYEPAALDYPLGKQLQNQFSALEWIPIENHNSIPFFRGQPNSEFPRMKQNIIIGTRKTHRYVENHKVSDYLVPYTSSGCSASCLYCYLVCNYNKCSYLRLFVNREQMLQKLIRFSENCAQEKVFEIGSNSDLVLENTITGNLVWTIEHFAHCRKGHLTFPTKFDMIDPLLPLSHNGKIIIRMSVNPQEVIKKTEFGTAQLEQRIHALNRLHDAGYQTGLLIAPVIFLENWETLYTQLLDILEQKLLPSLKRQLAIEIIFMTYSYVHKMINTEAFPNAVQLYSKEQMTGRGMGKYHYRPALKEVGEAFFRREIPRRFPESKILYIV